MNTQTKIAVALLLVLVTALTTTATLGYFIYERTLQGLVTSRFEFVARELKRKVEAGLDLGLPLGELENLNELLRYEARTDEAIVGLTIQNAKGTILFDTEPSRIGSQSTNPWQIPAPGAASKIADIIVHGSEICVPLVNSFGKVVGLLQVTYSQSYYDGKRAQTIRNIAETTAILLLLGSFVGLCGVLVISRPLTYAVARMEAGLQTILARIGLGRDTATEAGLDGEIAAFERKVFDAVSALERAGVATEGPAPRTTGER